ncbi:hypothetical protein LSG31_09805 [Fodinisporobacter ferrooxydans]|uniref:CopG family transcriptional regulator n=1 Tax=Fodinisporobacter ferrooxydans TaxID=2901836 RepID=A0ABY4CR32_9BACL|nr:hypothetical protein LSG31_09805 [Alicyclobacillaceae bacterium MYW30-H2]
MAYGNKVKLHYDIPIYIKEQLTIMAKRKGITATELLTRIIEEEYMRLKNEQK